MRMFSRCRETSLLSARPRQSLIRNAKSTVVIQINLYSKAHLSTITQLFGHCLCLASISYPKFVPWLYLVHHQGTISGIRGVPWTTSFFVHELAQRYNRHKWYKRYKWYKWYKPHWKCTRLRIMYHLAFIRGQYMLLFFAWRLLDCPLLHLLYTCQFLLSTHY